MMCHQIPHELHAPTSDARIQSIASDTDVDSENPHMDMPRARLGSSMGLPATPELIPEIAAA